MDGPRNSLQLYLFRGKGDVPSFSNQASEADILMNVQMWKHCLDNIDVQIHREGYWPIKFTYTEERFAEVLLDIAVDLYQKEKSVEIWRKKIDGGKRDLLFFIDQARKIKPSVPNNRFNIADYAVLLYAVMATLRDLEEDLVLRLKNGFIYEKSTIRHGELGGGTSDKGHPMTVLDFFWYLHEKWEIVSDKFFITSINAGVMAQNLWHTYFSKEHNQGRDYRHIAGYLPGITPEKDWAILRRNFEAMWNHPELWYRDIQGLEDHRQKSVAMIMGELHERYACQPEPKKQPGQEKRSTSRETKELEIVDRRTEAARFLALMHLVGIGKTSNANYEKVLSALSTEPQLPCECDDNCFCAEFCKVGNKVDCICRARAMFQKIDNGEINPFGTEEQIATANELQELEFAEFVEERIRALRANEVKKMEKPITPVCDKERKAAAGIGKATLQHAIKRKAQAAAVPEAPNLWKPLPELPLEHYGSKRGSKKKGSMRLKSLKLFKRVKLMTTKRAASE